MQERVRSIIDMQHFISHNISYTYSLFNESELYQVKLM
jgi:hypothetical protein